MNFKEYLEGNLDNTEQKIIKRSIKDSYKKINKAIKFLDAEEYEKTREVLEKLAGEISDIEMEINSAMASEE